MNADAAHEAMLYRKAEKDFCDCFLCAHRCHIAPGKRGICRVRENRDGTLCSLVYGKLIAAHVDPIEKKPLYHFMPGSVSYSIATTGCNFQCDFCQNWQISQGARDGDIPGRYTEPEEVVEAAESHGCGSISYTYTEPTIYFEYAFDCAKLAKSRGLRNNFVTNGYETPETVEKMAGVIDAANVDLKAFSDGFYRERCKARLEPVCESIRLMHQAGIHVEVTTLLIPGYNDDPDELKRLTEFLAGVSPDIAWHVSRYHPDYQFDHASVTPSELIFRALETGKQAGLRFVYAGNLPAGEYENTRCPKCGTTVISRSGFSARITGLKGSACSACGEQLPIIR
jgi:pyruvate formate lyase activating enzyme